MTGGRHAGIRVIRMASLATAHTFLITSAVDCRTEPEYLK